MQKLLTIILAATLIACKKSPAPTPPTPHTQNISTITIQPYTNEILTTTLPAGPAIIHQFKKTTPTPIPKSLHPHINPTDQITHLTLKTKSPKNAHLIYNHTTQTLLASGKVTFTEKVHARHQDYLYLHLSQFPSKIKTQVTITKIPRQNTPPEIWHPQHLTRQKTLQRLTSTSPPNEKKEATSNNAKQLLLSIESTPDLNFDNIYTRFEIHLPETIHHPEITLKTDCGLTNNHPLIFEIHRTKTHHILLTLKSTIIASDNFSIPPKNEYPSPKAHPQFPNLSRKLTLKSYSINPELIEAITWEEPPPRSASDDPFAEPTPTQSSILLDELTPLQRLTPRIIPPNIPGYFHPTDTVRDINPLLASNGIKTHPQGFTIYNQTKNHLHILSDQTTHDLLEQLVQSIKYDPPSQLYTTLTINQKPTPITASTFHYHGSKTQITQGKNQLITQNTLHDDGMTTDTQITYNNTKLPLQTYKLGETKTIPLNKTTHLTIHTTRRYTTLSTNTPNLITEITP